MQLCRIIWAGRCDGAATLHRETLIRPNRATVKRRQFTGCHLIGRHFIRRAVVHASSTVINLIPGRLITVSCEPVPIITQTLYKVPVPCVWGIIIIIITNEYYYGGAVALLLQDHLTMSLSRFADQTATTIYMSTTVQQEHKKRVNPQGNTL